MIGLLLGVALLALSWLFGVSFYLTANRLPWAVAVALGGLLLCRAEVAIPGRRTSLASITLLVLPALLLPQPYGLGPALVAVGLALGLIAGGRAIATFLVRGLVASGVVLSIQGLAVQAYAGLTARSHDLPGPLVELLAGVGRLLGVDCGASGVEVSLRTLRGVHRLAGTWDLLVDPASAWFLAGGIALLVLLSASSQYGLRECLKAAGRLTLVVAAWLPLRAGLWMALFVDRTARFTAPTPLHVMNHFFSPWPQAVAVGLLALAAGRLVALRRRAPVEEPVASGRNPVPLAAGLVALSAALTTVAIFWDPPGRTKAGRVMFVERHSTWEPSTRPYDTTWYGEPSGYNYYAAYDYCGRFFEMSHLLESEAIDDRRLAACDVLVIKTPTARYTPREIDAIERFVASGGGLLLIGEHTNYERTGTYLSDIGRRFGFTYRHDLLFGFDVAYDQHYRRPTVPHPAVAHLAAMDFAVSCSIDPGTREGKAVIASTGLWSLPPDYSAENFFPMPYQGPSMRYGAFVQAWAVEHGQGRVLAFTDSTIFSNFCVFEPGKLDLLLGMLSWLNQTNVLGDPRRPLVGLALAPLLVAGWLLRRRTFPPVLLLAAGACGAVLAAQAVAAAHRWSLPAPQPKRPMTRVIIDRTVSDVPLTKSGFTDLGGQGYGLVEQWIGRLGYFPSRAADADAFAGKALVVLCPRLPVSDAYRRSLVDWVEKGGRLLVFDSPEHASSTANRLLEPFKLEVRHGRAWQGQLVFGQGKRGLSVERACELSGGEAIAWLGDHPVAVRARHGQGTVMLVGFGSLFDDEHMGSYWNVDPDAATRARYDLLFGLMRVLVEDRPLSDLP